MVKRIDQSQKPLSNRTLFFIRGAGEASHKITGEGRHELVVSLMKVAVGQMCLRAATLSKHTTISKSSFVMISAETEGWSQWVHVGEKECSAECSRTLGATFGSHPAPVSVLWTRPRPLTRYEPCPFPAELQLALPLPPSK